MKASAVQKGVKFTHCKK